MDDGGLVVQAEANPLLRAGHPKERAGPVFGV